MLDRLDTKKGQELRLSVHSVQQATTKILKNPSLRLDAELASPCTTHHSGRVISNSLRSKFMKLLQFLPVNIQYTQKKRTRRDYPK